MDIRCTLRNELNLLAEREMQNKGYKWKADTKISSFHQYMNLLNREISPIPRMVFMSKNLDCPLECKDGFDALVNGFKLGFNINAYLSSNLKDASYNDSFLNDFGLHHFHLGTGICESGKSKGFINRTGPILIAYVTEESVYFLRVSKHGKGGVPYLWTEQSLIEIMHEEWPELLKPYTIYGISQSSEILTSEQRQNLRKNSCNALIEMPDGTNYAPIGGGITSADTNIKFTRDFDVFYAEAKLILKELCKYINKTNDYSMRFPVKLSLKALSNGFLYEDVINKTQYLVRLTNSINLQITGFRQGELPEYYPHFDGYKVNAITESIITNKN
ncbi:hypothetical protein [Aliivibrio logei]|uniref:Uncharacterized protein n=1 Tax=Aliivibrio logei TaxID=688 RepID=A0A1B9NUP3_ALILO|nr:hypothetical protein [Aliivibrio logei]OCH17760.1 hypothetical protein A6E04_18030 [Aliivibrio logei]